MSRRGERSFIFGCIALFALSFFVFTAETTAQRKRSPKKKARVVKIIAPPDLAATIKTVKSDPDLVRRLETFDKVVSILTQNYFDPNYNGLDWPKVKADYRILVAATKTDTQLYNILDELVSKLGRSHLGIIRPEIFEQFKDARAAALRNDPSSQKNSADSEDRLHADDDDDPDIGLIDDHLSQYGVGISLRLLDGKFVVVDVEPQSSAEKAGMTTGMIIDKISSVSLDTMYKMTADKFPDLKTAQRYLPLQIENFLLNGGENTEVTVDYFDKDGRPLQARLARHARPGQLITIGSNIPPQYFLFETKDLSPKVGYIKFNAFAPPAVEKLCSALSQFKNKEALIIDLRGNIGGLMLAIQGIAGMLSSEPMDFGRSIYRDRTDQLKISPKVKNFSGRLVFLVDGHTVSAAEILASGLQESGRATIVGETTAGEALPAVSVTLPTGARLVYPIANYITHYGFSVEGKGVIPDVMIGRSRSELLNGRDSQLEKAIELAGITIVKRGNTQAATDPDEDAIPPPPIQPPPPSAKKSQTSGALPPPPPVGITSAATLQPGVKDARSTELLNTFIKKIGGSAFSEIRSYSGIGRGTLGSYGSNTEVIIKIYRDRPDLQALILNAPGVGDMRILYKDKKVKFETSSGGVRELSSGTTAASDDIYEPLFRLTTKDSIKSSRYVGEYVINAQKVDLIEADVEGMGKVAMSFDKQTGLIAGFAGTGIGLFYSDYRVSGNFMLPYHIRSGSQMDVILDTILIDPVIAPATFESSPQCFDKPL